ncbi:MAG: glutamate racemase [Christensenellales bacterium]|jgi:glutamate racemase
MRIALLDSGIGGLGILSVCLNVFPDCKIDYLADTLYAPFGTQNAGILYNRLNDDIAFLRSRKADLIILACNTASALLADEKKDGHILGIEPDVKRALAEARGQILVFSTPITAASALLQNTAKREARVKIIADKYLAPLIECYAPDFARVMPYFIRLASREGECGGIVLGCTHYLFLQEHIRKTFPGVKIFNYEKTLTGQLLKLKNKFSPLPSADKVINLMFTGNTINLAGVNIAYGIAPRHKIFSSSIKITLT